MHGFLKKKTWRENGGVWIFHSRHCNSMRGRAGEATLGGVWDIEIYSCLCRGVLILRKTLHIENFFRGGRNIKDKEKCASRYSVFFSVRLRRRGKKRNKFWNHLCSKVIVTVQTHFYGECFCGKNSQRERTWRVFRSSGVPAEGRAVVWWGDGAAEAGGSGAGFCGGGTEWQKLSVRIVHPCGGVIQYIEDFGTMAKRKEIFFKNKWNSSKKIKMMCRTEEPKKIFMSKICIVTEK